MTDNELKMMACKLRLVSLIVCLLTSAGYGGVCIEYQELAKAQDPHFSLDCYSGGFDEYDCFVKGVEDQTIWRGGENVPAETHWLTDTKSCEDFCNRVYSDIVPSDSEIWIDDEHGGFYEEIRCGVITITKRRNSNHTDWIYDWRDKRQRLKQNKEKKK